LKTEPSTIPELERGLGYRFRDASLLKLALTPPSAGHAQDNQRLEFLGDSVLHVCVSSLVYREHPAWPEGALSKLRGMLVCTDALHAWALDLGLPLETGPRSPRKAQGGARNALADAMEALLAAVFLDLQAQGKAPFDEVLALVERRFLPQIRAAYVGVWEARDSKTTLQERAASLALPPPQYEVLERAGPDHAPTFRVRAILGALRAEATAGSLKRAQMEAARLLLEEMSGPGAPAS
jgi:ribonuclease-3